MNRRAFLVSCVSTAVLAGSLSGCATAYRPAPPAFHEILQQPYRLDAGDRLRVTVFEQADLTNTYIVDKAGYIAFPLVGAVAARGRTIKEVEAGIAEKLARGFIRNPDVSVEVDRYRPFFIMGEVGNAGPIYLCSRYDGSKCNCHCRWLHTKGASGQRRYHASDQWQGHDRSCSDHRSDIARRYNIPA